MFNLFSLFFRRRSYYSFSKSHIASWDKATSAPISIKEYQSSVDDLQIARVLTILDGDTIIVSFDKKQIKIRLDAIDCPENDQEWGDIAKYGLIKLIGGKSIRLEPHGLDTYGRTLATIFSLNDKNEWMNINERMVTLGHAWVMRLFYGHLPKDRQQRLNQLERWAKSKNIGLWQKEKPIPPWAWRNDAS